MATATWAEQANEFYSKAPSSTECPSCSPPPPPSLLPRPPAVIMKASYGCSNPYPQGINESITAVDLGCGAGRDLCYLAALGASTVIGVDGSTELLQLAQTYAVPHITSLKHSPNALFVKGQLEDIYEIVRGTLQTDNSVKQTVAAADSLNAVNGVEDAVDDAWKPQLCISNCVLSVCYDKLDILTQVWKLLKPGGEFFFSDIYCSRRLKENLVSDRELLVTGLSGSSYWRDFLEISKKAGFKDVRLASCRKLGLTETEEEKVGSETEYYSLLFRLFKVDTPDNSRENYGHVATYLGNASAAEITDGFKFDFSYYFPKGEEVSVDRNLAHILSNSWIQRYFSVKQTYNGHLGAHWSGSIEANILEAAKKTKAGCC